MKCEVCEMTMTLCDKGPHKTNYAIYEVWYCEHCGFYLTLPRIL